MAEPHESEVAGAAEHAVPIDPLLEVGLGVILLLLTLTLVMAAVRVVRGPHLADRVVALDLVAYVTVCIIGTGAVLLRDGALLDVALVLSLLAFLGTVAFARFLERAYGKEHP